ncbi:MAG: hypothetical protein JZU60_01755 [Ilumatobacteraceae bacterium]|nr:hypothetical protein [Ilumatobacteraceae bacterium]
MDDALTMHLDQPFSHLDGNRQELGGFQAFLIEPLVQIARAVVLLNNGKAAAMLHDVMHADNPAKPHGNQQVVFVLVAQVLPDRKIIRRRCLDDDGQTVTFALATKDLAMATLVNLFLDGVAFKLDHLAMVGNAGIDEGDGLGHVVLGGIVKQTMFRS